MQRLFGSADMGLVVADLSKASPLGLTPLLGALASGTQLRVRSFERVLGRF